jgi:hypothetical protein
MTPQAPDAPTPPAVLPEWRTVIDREWEDLRRRALGLDASVALTLARVNHECGMLTAVTAWFQSHGNITRAAKRLGVSRRLLRERIAPWRKDHPQLVPTPVKIDRSRKAHRRNQESAGE